LYLFHVLTSLRSKLEQYKEQVIDKNTKVLAVEASRAIEYYKYADDVIGIDSLVHQSSKKTI